MGKAKKSALKAQCAPIMQRVRDRQNLIAVHCLEKTNDHSRFALPHCHKQSTAQIGVGLLTPKWLVCLDSRVVANETDIPK